MEIRIDGYDLPGSECGPSKDRPGGYQQIHVGVQRRGKRDELLGLTRGDAGGASWTLDATATATTTGGGIDLKGRHIEGPPGGRFVYLSWVTVDDSGTATLFRRAKLCLDAIPPDVLAAALESGLLIGRLGLTDAKGNPTCASVRPPAIVWSAGGGG